MLANPSRKSVPVGSERRLTLAPEDLKSLEAFANARDRYINALVADEVTPRFAYRDLGIRTVHQTGDADNPLEYRGNPKSPPFAPVIAGEGRWLRTSYLSVEEGQELCHLVRISGRDPRTFVVHYQYAKKNSEAFNGGERVPDPIHAEYTLSASTVSAR